MVHPPSPPTSLLTLLAGLPAETAATLLADWLPAEVISGQIIHHEQSSGDVLYIIQSGRLRVTDKKSSRTLGPGAIFGQMAGYGYSLNGAAVTAVEPARLRILSRVMVDQLRRQFPAVAGQLPLNPPAD